MFQKRCLQLGLCRVACRARLVDLLPGDELPIQQWLHARQRRLALGRGLLRAGDGRGRGQGGKPLSIHLPLRQSDLALQRDQLRLQALRFIAIGSRIDREEHVTLLHGGVVLDVELDDPASHLRCNANRIGLRESVVRARVGIGEPDGIGGRTDGEHGNDDQPDRVARRRLALESFIRWHGHACHPRKKRIHPPAPNRIASSR